MKNLMKMYMKMYMKMKMYMCMYIVLLFFAGVPFGHIRLKTPERFFAPKEADEVCQV